MNELSNEHRSPSRRRRSPLQRAVRIVPAFLVMGAAVAACGSGSTTAGNPAPAGSNTGSSSNGGSSTAGVETATKASLGSILVDSKGFTLYRLNKDSMDHSTCTGGCTKIWPPLLVTGGGHPMAGSGVTGLGTISVAGGEQVTYHGMPLYTFTGDTSPGQTNGQNVTDTWGTWFVVSTSGGTGGGTGGGGTTTTTTAGGGGGGTTTTTTAGGGGGAGF